jgi:hypothetical protein
MDDDGWKMMLEGFMEPWKPGPSVSLNFQSSNPNLKQNIGFVINLRVSAVR